ncbi:glycosyltransferase [Paraburkholderia madseniana]|uniref:Glycosyltransferase n=1 Tax=Paraburkholderia madseniana TaxID=2599607 RepID=A0A6N6WFL4_9BURK|nr:glycosyltransferase family 2 protein [Paraburkholderia madseniana]KAE8759296.1 glycosyltransferase [Paraburkholderia madseniana]
MHSTAPQHSVKLAQNSIAPELSIIVPTYNEKANVGELVRRLNLALGDIAWEVIFVDDNSPDRTYETVKQIASSDSRVRCIHRIGRRGLSGACIEGILSSAAPTVAVMDADLQHDESILPKMYEAIRNGADLVIGTRYSGEEASSQGLSPIRQWGSNLATGLARKFLHLDVSDPMSGFFMLPRTRVDAITSKLSDEGFKILLDIIASTPTRLKTVEIPYHFRQRVAGESKLDSLVTAEYLGLLCSKLSGGFLPIRFLMFLIVGATGIAVHLATLQVATHAFGLSFPSAQLTATLVAIAWNFILNNQLTYRDRRLKGIKFLFGMATFYAVCSLGTFANVGAASWLFEHEPNQIFAGLAGAILGAVFNYAASSALTWHK